jgi:hypothetical protein
MSTRCTWLCLLILIDFVSVCSSNYYKKHVAVTSRDYFFVHLSFEFSVFHYEFETLELRAHTLRIIVYSLLVGM